MKPKELSTFCVLALDKTVDECLPEEIARYLGGFRHSRVPSESGALQCEELTCTAHCATLWCTSLGTCEINVFPENAA